MLSAGLSGLALGGSLIVAIGAQNAFILRQGLLRRHVFILCLICALSDALLIAAGVGGMGALVSRSKLLILLVTLGGAVFLGSYAVLAFRRAARPAAMATASAQGLSLRAAIVTCLAFTFLNPHVYLDTVLLLGSLSAGFEGMERWAYGAGAASASFLWFFGLGYGARLLAPVFARPAAWRVLDGLIGLVMSALALGLLSNAAAGL
ncbi:LysE family transporter [Neorhizobium sp. NCHU2750]|uniref:LysE/ArgO family amino acid transporter n=1 Tax=Neorhizobium sp. NCHU2750 TaxID=1825976 RepID=UPI001968D7ED